MSVFSVDTAAVAGTAGRVRARITSIQAEVDAMQSDLNLLQSSWTGAAANSMTACASGWHATQLQVQASLDSIGTALDHAALSYSEAEQANTSRFSAGIS